MLTATAIALVALAVSVLAYRAAIGASASRVGASAPAPPLAIPALTVTVIDGRARRALSDDTRDYAVHVLLRNDGAPTTIGAIALRVTYRTRANFLGAVDLEPLHDANSGSDVRLTLPAAVVTGATTSGWLFFRTSNVIPRHCRVNDYALVILPEGGRRLIVDASLPALLATDTDGPGPATWGWD